MSVPKSLSPDLVEFLLSEHAQRAAAALAPVDLEPAATLATLNRLRRHFTPDQAGVLLTLAQLRQRAQTKFPDAQRMFFTPDALEQATAWPVALHRAQWIHRHSAPGPILDLGCGIGGDTLALARYRSVIAYERDPARLPFAQANARAVGVAEQVEWRAADWTAELAAGILPHAAAAFVDPSRRSGERRIFSLHQMHPPLDVLLRLQKHIPNLAAKVMPGVDDAELPPGCSVEFVSHEGVCKEAVLWFGALARHKRWASVHDGTTWHALESSGEPPPLGDLPAGSVLYEPDPAIIRAGAFSELCTLLNARLIDPHIAYLVSESLLETPFATPFLVQEIHPFNLKVLNKRLRELNISSVELKKRGAPFEPESLRPRLKLPAQGAPSVVLFTRLRDAPIMVIARRP
jgi:SAM-dependent methyltransferase